VDMKRKTRQPRGVAPEGGRAPSWRAAA
jgi:hypothetical protein